MTEISPLIMYRKTKQKVLLAEKFLEKYGEEFSLKFLHCCLDSAFDCLKSDYKTPRKAIGALLLDLSSAPLKEVCPESEKLDPKKLIMNLMCELSEESEEKADLFHYYLRNAERSQKKQQ